MNVFGEQIEKERKLAGLSIPELSQKTGLSEEVITNLENGVIFPNVRHLMTLAGAFGKKQGHFLTKFVYKEI